ncbi:5'-nucleotidase, C-terminal domain [Abditibacterium utsteinense]|uniref:5'-nucleotidase, C-terminal domain n=1 Tax=Abditibacterium utsteinense TaxID=1960156 RepID=A0A2S8SX43_9BACT|nr:5'-nucleotidase [Abditibacterium utsteinense]PQV65373.1 5'-nucleotidase, C-terminal domain [Abditibacterium utsteinense]
MKRLFQLVLLLAAAFCFVGAPVGTRPARAQSLGKASADFPNLKPNRQETAWGRLVADAVQSAGKADVALISAGALRSGTLEAGDVESTDLAALLSFGEDNVVTLSLSGAQIRAALERAASAFPTGSPAFLHCAGLSASFDAGAPSGKRVTSIRVAGRALDEAVTYATAMPVSLAEGAAGYFNIWSGAQARASNISLQDAIADVFREKKEIAPIESARFGPK